jgi:protein-tyrosine phosphatase
MRLHVLNYRRYEHIIQAKKRKADLEFSAPPELKEALMKPARIPGINYIEININSKDFERALLWQLCLWSLM